MAGFQHTGGFGSQTADPGSFMATFQPLPKVAMELPTLAVLWPFSSNCRPWQFHGHFSANQIKYLRNAFKQDEAALIS